MTIFLSSQEIGSLLTIKDYIETIESAYRQMGQGNTTMLPRINVDSSQVPKFLKILPASLTESGIAGIHVYSSGGDGIFKKVIILFEINSGNLEAIIESDRIGWLVPGAASAVATKFLAKKEAKVMSIFGSGRQARAQLSALAFVRNIELVKVYSPDKTRREQYCEEMGKLLGLNIIAVNSPDKAIQGCDILSTTTNSTTPLFNGDLIEPGTHINAIGAHYPDRREVDSVCVQRSKVVVDSKERALKEEGELLIPIREGVIKSDHIYGELGEIVAGKKQGRVDEKEITLFLSGAIAIEYVAIATKAYQKAQQKGIGQELRVEKDLTIPKSLYSKREKITH